LVLLGLVKVLFSMDRYHQISPGITSCYQVLPGIARYHQVLPGITRYNQSSGIVGIIIYWFPNK
jgi:hypothetical protein